MYVRLIASHKWLALTEYSVMRTNVIPNSLPGRALAEISDHQLK